MDRRSLGMIALRLLGSSIAERFLHAGHAVIGYDIDPERRLLLASLGGRPTDSAGEAIRAAGRTVLSLPTTDVVEAVLAEVAPAVRSGLVVVDTTTGDPDRRPAVGARLAAAGAR